MSEANDDMFWKINKERLFKWTFLVDIRFANKPDHYHVTETCYTKRGAKRKIKKIFKSVGANPKTLI